MTALAQIKALYAYNEWADGHVMDAASKRPEIGSIYAVYRANVPQVFVDIDRDKVLKVKVPLLDVNNTLGSLLGSVYVNDFNRFGRVYKVYIQADGAYRRRTEDLGLFYVRSSSNRMIPLSTLVTTRPISGPEFTNRFNLYRAAEISGIPAPGYSSAQALAALERYLEPGLVAGLREAAESGSAKKRASALTIPGSRSDRAATVGQGRARDLAVNVVLPFLHALAVPALDGPALDGKEGHHGAGEANLDLYRRFPKLQENELTREMACQLLDPAWRPEVKGARRQQGLLHLHQLLCGVS